MSGSRDSLTTHHPTYAHSEIRALLKNENKKRKQTISPRKLETGFYLDKYSKTHILN